MESLFILFYFEKQSTFYMKNNEAIEAVKEIRTMMEKSSRFLSFSGTSAILIGIYALLGAFVVDKIISPINELPHELSEMVKSETVVTVIIVTMMVFVVSLGTVLFFSVRKAKKMKQPFFSKPACSTILNFFIPLSAGAVFSLALFSAGNVGLIAPTMLLFYGLSLIHASKYTYGSIFWLGLSELFLGLICAFMPGDGLVYWAIGFGVLHIVYGVYFYLGVERYSIA